MTEEERLTEMIAMSMREIDNPEFSEKTRSEASKEVASHIVKLIFMEGRIEHLEKRISRLEESSG